MFSVWSGLLNQTFKSQNGSNFSINLVRFKPIKWKKGFDVWYLIWLERDFTKTIFQSMICADGGVLLSFKKCVLEAKRKETKKLKILPVNGREQGRIQRFWKGVVLCVVHHGWPAKKIFGFRWSKKAEITLETISFWQNIFVSIFRFSPFLSIKSYQFFKIY